MRILIRQGEGPADSIERICRERNDQRAEYEKMLRQPLELLDSNRKSFATAGGDTEKLRGIPALAVGVGSAMRGTNPLAALIAKETRREQGR